MHYSRLQRRGVLEMPTSGECKHCRKTLPFKGVRVNSFCSTHCRNAHSWSNNSLELGEQNRNYRALHRDEILERQRAHRRDNLQEVRAKEKIYRDRDRIGVNLRAAAYREQNRETINAKIRAWG